MQVTVGRVLCGVALLCSVIAVVLAAVAGNLWLTVDTAGVVVSTVAGLVAARRVRR